MKKHVRGAGRRLWIWGIIFGLLLGCGWWMEMDRSKMAVHAVGTKWNGLCGCWSN